MTGVRLRRLSPVILALTLVMASGCGGTATAPTGGAPSGTAGQKASAQKKLTRILVAIPSVDPDFGALVLAQEKGYYQKRGVSVSIEPMATPAELAALLGGKVQFFTIGAIALEAAWKGVPVRVVAAMDVHPAQVLVARPGIRSPADLKGKVVATNGSQDILAQMASWVLAHHFGVGPTQVTYEGLGTDAKKIAALEGGAVSAAVVDAGPAEQAIGAGMHRLFNFGDYLTMPLSSLATTTSYIRSHKAAVQAVVLGTVEALDFMRAHRKQTVAFYEKQYHLTQAEAQATYTIERKAYPPDGRFPTSAAQLVLAIGQTFAAAHGQTIKHRVPAKLSSQQVSQLIDFSLLPSPSKG